MDDLAPARRPERLPVVLSREEVRAVLAQLLIRDGKGAKDRYALLPQSVTERLQLHLQTVWKLYREDLEARYGTV